MENSSHNRNFLIVGGVLAVVLVGGFFLWQNDGTQTVTLAPVSDDMATTTTTSTSTKVAVRATGDVVIKDAPVKIPVSTNTSSVKAPDYKAPIIFSASLDAAAQAAITGQFTALKATIAKNPIDYNSWVELGIIRKIAGDYKGAEADWTYVTGIYANDAVAFNDLGDLYAGYLHDLPKAEKNYLAGIKVAPNSINSYQALSDIYAAGYVSSVHLTSESILKQGIAANPDSTYLQLLLARHYKTKGDAVNAKAQYDAAYANATRQSQKDLAAQIKVEAGE